MSGAVAAHASYNGSGTQGLAVTNKISDANQGDVVSVFWNESDTTRQLLYGSSTLEIPTSGSGKNASWGGSQIFTVNNDIDCLGDMYLSVTVEMNTPVDTPPLIPHTSLDISDEKFGWGYALNDNASSQTSSIVKEAASQGVTINPIAQGSRGHPVNKFQYDVAPESFDVRVNEVEDSLTGAFTQPKDAGARAIGQSYNPISGASATNLAFAIFENAWEGGYFKKLATGETHPVNYYDTASATAPSTFNTSPPNGWAFVGDPNLQILTLQIDDLHELVKWYNDATYKPFGLASTATGGYPFGFADVANGTGHVFPPEAHRPDGGCYMTVEDAIETYNWYWGLHYHGLAPNLLTLPQPVFPGVTPESDNGPHWTSLYREVPEHAVLPLSGVSDLANSGTTPLVLSPALFSAARPIQFSSTGWGGSALKSKVKFPLAKIIKRVEFQVGTQIWQTLEYNDLLSINATEVPESSYNRLGLQTTGYVKGDGTRCAAGNPEWVPGKKYQAFIPLPTLTKTLGPQLENFTQNSEDGYLMAAAPHQNVKIKVHYANFSDIWDTSKVRAYPSYSGDVIDKDGVITGKGTYISNSAHDWTPNATLATKLYGQHMIMSNEEREQMKNMPNGIPKRLKMTQNVNTIFPAKIYPDQPVIIDLDHFSLYGSHLVISADFPNRGGYGQDSVPTLKHAELKLNSSSFSGQLDGQLLRGITNKSLGLYSNDFDIDKQKLDSGMGYYVFPLAARSYGGSSVPLNRFDNIRLSLTFTHPDITSSGYTVDQGTINVTCVGETTGLYKNGAASLAMY